MVCMHLAGLIPGLLSSHPPSLVPRPSHMCDKEGLVFWSTFLVTAPRSESSNQIAECVIICDNIYLAQEKIQKATVDIVQVLCKLGG